MIESLEAQGLQLAKEKQEYLGKQEKGHLNKFTFQRSYKWRQGISNIFISSSR